MERKIIKDKKGTFKERLLKIAGGNKFEVEQLNQRSINLAQETMSNIDTYVKNLTKFYRG